MAGSHGQDDKKRSFEEFDMADRGHRRVHLIKKRDQPKKLASRRENRKNNDTELGCARTGGRIPQRLIYRFSSWTVLLIEVSSWTINKNHFIS
jgi:superfamily I DNA and/or RNA helicase